jgi:hypothetical protein
LFGADYPKADPRGFQVVHLIVIDRFCYGRVHVSLDSQATVGTLVELSVSPKK